MTKTYELTESEAKLIEGRRAVEQKEIMQVCLGKFVLMTAVAWAEFIDNDGCNPTYSEFVEFLGHHLMIPARSRLGVDFLMQTNYSGFQDSDLDKRTLYQAINDIFKQVDDYSFQLTELYEKDQKL